MDCRPEMVLERTASRIAEESRREARVGHSESGRAIYGDADSTLEPQDVFRQVIFDLEELAPPSSGFGFTA